MSESETQELAWLNFVESVVEKVDGRVCHVDLSERERERDRQTDRQTELD